MKEKLETGVICIPYLPSSEQTVDVLTKRLSTVQFDRLVSKLAMEDIYKVALGRVLVVNKIIRCKISKDFILFSL